MRDCLDRLRSTSLKPLMLFSAKNTVSSLIKFPALSLSCPFFVLPLTVTCTLFFILFEALTLLPVLFLHYIRTVARERWFLHPPANTTGVSVTGCLMDVLAVWWVPREARHWRNGKLRGLCMIDSTPDHGVAHIMCCVIYCCCFCTLPVRAGFLEETER